MNEKKCNICDTSVSACNEDIIMITSPNNKTLCSNCIDTTNSVLSGVRELEIDEIKEFSNEETLLNNQFKNDADPFGNFLSNLKKTATPKLIFEKLNEYVVAQDDAKKTLSIAITKHINKADDIKSSNVLVLGPSGTGKTELIRTISKTLEIPFVIADASQLTATGYVGDDVSSIFKSLFDKYHGDLSVIEKSIVFIDEVDKIARTNSDVTTLAIQQELLRIIEGTIVRVKIEEEGYNFTEYVDTSNMLFVFSGAFIGLKDQNKSKSLGFVSEENEEKEIKEVSDDDLINYGLIPEFVGRISLVTETKDLTIENIKSIFKNKNNGLIKEVVNLFSKNGNIVEFTEDFINKLALAASEKKTGARGLKYILDRKLKDLYFDMGDIHNSLIKINWNKIERLPKKKALQEN